MNPLANSCDVNEGVGNPDTTPAAAINQGTPSQHFNNLDNCEVMSAVVTCSVRACL